MAIKYKGKFYIGRFYLYLEKCDKCFKNVKNSINSDAIILDKRQYKRYLRKCLKNKLIY